MSYQSRLYRQATTGPADPKASTRAKLYAGLSALLGLVTLGVTFGLLNAEQGASIAQIVDGVIGLIGAGGLAIAASKTNRQVKDGTFDPAPPTVTVSPIDNAFDALNQIRAQIDATVADAQTRVTDGITAITGAVSSVPGINVVSGPVADLIRSVSASVPDDRR